MPSFGSSSQRSPDERPLPAKGAVILAAPLKIKQGSGSPLRGLTLVAKGAG